MAAIAKYPAKRAVALSTVLARDYGLLVKWKALQTYVLREDLWTTKRPMPHSSMPASSSSSALVAVAAAMPTTGVVAPSIVEAKIGDLPSHRDTIVQAIRGHPGMKSIALATLMEKSYAVRVHPAA